MNLSVLSSRGGSMPGYSTLFSPDPKPGTPFKVVFVIEGLGEDDKPLAVIGDEYVISATTPGTIFFPDQKARVESIHTQKLRAELTFVSPNGFVLTGDRILEFTKSGSSSPCHKETVKVGMAKPATRSTDEPPPIPPSPSVKVNKHLLPGKGKSTLLEPVDEKKEKWKWKNHWMIGGFLVLLLSVGGYFGYKNLYPAKVPPHAQAKVQPKAPKIEEEVFETDEETPEPEAETAESITSGSLAEAAAKQKKEAETLAEETKAAEAITKAKAEKDKAETEAKAKATPEALPENTAPAAPTGNAPKRYEKIHFSHLPPATPFTGVAPGHM